MRMLLAILLLPILAVSASAVTVCHDFTWWRITTQDGNNLGPTDLKNKLSKATVKYRSIYSCLSSDAAKFAKGSGGSCAYWSFGAATGR